MDRTIDHEALESLGASTADVVIGLDQDGHICLFNTLAEIVLGVPDTDALGKHPAELSDLRPIVSLADWVLSSGQSAREQVSLPSGDTWIHLLYVPESRKPGLAVRKENTSQSSEPMREIVHDLKVRIASVKGFLDLIDAAGKLNKSQGAFLRRAYLSLAAMLNQVHEILDMTWLDQDGELERRVTDLNHLAQHAVIHLDGYAHCRDTKVVLDLSPEGCFVEGDERRLQSSISNLVSNAIKYSPEGGTVQVSVRGEDQVVILRVKDQGIGIAPEHLPHLFQRFYRVITPQTRRIEGSGLGLAIVKEIIEKHGGEVFVQSEIEQGSVFGFSLPAVAVPD